MNSQKKRKTGLILIILLAVILLAGIIAKFAASTGGREIYSVKVDDVTVYLAEENRKEAIENMMEMASAEWKISEDITYQYVRDDEKAESASDRYVTLKAGNRKGIAYTRVNRNMHDGAGMQKIADNALKNTGEIQGLDCASAATYALGLKTEKEDAYYSKDLYKHAVKADFNSASIYDDVYAKIKPGDLLVMYQSSDLRHTMMVLNVEIVLSDKGLADPEKSRIYIIDQLNPDVSMYADNSLSSWRNNKTVSAETGKRNNIFTFKELAEKMHYLPVNIEELK